MDEDANVLGNGSTFTTIDEFTDAAVLIIGTMCPTEMAGVLAKMAELAPQAFQVAVANIAGTPFEHHDHEGDDDPSTW